MTIATTAVVYTSQAISDIRVGESVLYIYQIFQRIMLQKGEVDSRYLEVQEHMYFEIKGIEMNLSKTLRSFFFFLTNSL